MTRRGFTLVEILLYVALFAITMSALSSVYISSLSTDLLAKRKQDLVETQRHAGIRLRETIQSANVITVPASGSASSLTVEGAGIDGSPVTFSVVSGRLYVETATVPATAVTPADITVAAFTATRLGGSPPGVEIVLTMTAESGTTTLTEISDFIVTLRYE